MADKQIKPTAPSCEGRHFSQLPQPDGWDRGVPWPSPDENYYDVKFDADNNVIADGKYNVLPENATPQEGAYGSRMFADADALKGANATYGPEDANPVASVVWVDNSRADRGEES